jgi:hypothetical protein
MFVGQDAHCTSDKLSALMHADIHAPESYMYIRSWKGPLMLLYIESDLQLLELWMAAWCGLSTDSEHTKPLGMHTLGAAV